jgi:hypothetical protein
MMGGWLQAQQLVDLMSREHPKPWIVELLLPVMANPAECLTLVRRNLTFVQTFQVRNTGVRHRNLHS